MFTDYEIEQIGRASKELNSFQHQELTPIKCVHILSEPQKIVENYANAPDRVNFKKAIYRLHIFPSGRKSYVFSHLEG